MRKYETTDDSRLRHYPKKEKSMTLPAALRHPRKDIHVEKQLALDYFEKNKQDG